MRTSTRGMSFLSISVTLLAATSCMIDSAETVDLVSFTNAHGAACTALVVLASTGSEYVSADDETESSVDCEFPPEGTVPVREERQSLPDPDPDSDDSRIQLVTFIDAHGRACMTATSKAGPTDEIDLTCEYPEEPEESEDSAPQETVMPH